MTQADGIDHVGGDRGGGDADANFGDAELGVRGGEGDVDAADDADAAAEAGAVDEGDRGFRKLVQKLHRPGGGDGGGVVLGRGVMGDFTEPSYVGTGLEVPAGALDDETADGGVFCQVGQALDQGVQHGGIVRIADLGAVEGDGGDAACVGREEDGGLDHRRTIAGGPTNGKGRFLIEAGSGGSVIGGVTGGAIVLAGSPIGGTDGSLMPVPGRIDAASRTGSGRLVLHGQRGGADVLSAAKWTRAYATSHT